MDSMLWELGAAAFAAGIVDAVMGGGGMIQVPALFALLPGVAPVALLGTNKIASSVGTAGAALQYLRSNRPRWSTVAAAVLAAGAFSLAGAYVLTLIPAAALRKALPVLLLAVLAYSLGNHLGERHAPRHAPAREAAVAAAAAGAVGFYDGIFGPGAGAFYKLVYVRLLGFDFLNAAAPAKLSNLASNLGAIALFVTQGVVIWKLALLMAAANFAGGQLGARVALRLGNRFIRWAFIAVVAALVGKTYYDGYIAPFPAS